MNRARVKKLGLVVKYFLFLFVIISNFIKGDIILIIVSSLAMAVITALDLVEMYKKD